MALGQHSQQNLSEPLTLDSSACWAPPGYDPGPLAVSETTVLPLKLTPHLPRGLPTVYPRHTGVSVFTLSLLLKANPHFWFLISSKFWTYSISTG